MSRESIIRGHKANELRKKGYRRVSIDAEGRIAVEVDEARLSPEDHELYRRVWGPEWPVVRSDRWKPPVKQGKTVIHTPDEEQFQFHSREY